MFAAHESPSCVHRGREPRDFGLQLDAHAEDLALLQEAEAGPRGGARARPGECRRHTGELPAVLEAQHAGHRSVRREWHGQRHGATAGRDHLAGARGRARAAGQRSADRSAGRGAQCAAGGARGRRAHGSRVRAQRVPADDRGGLYPLGLHAAVRGGRDRARARGWIRVADAGAGVFSAESSWKKLLPAPARSSRRPKQLQLRPLRRPAPDARCRPAARARPPRPDSPRSARRPTRSRYRWPASRAAA